MRNNDWANSTSPEQTYDLTMYDEGGSCIEGVDLSRKEYIALKEHLAKMRGIPCDLSEDDDEPESQAASEKKADREHVIAFLRDKVNDCHLGTALMALELIVRNNGCSTPAENFIWSLIRNSSDGITPEDAKDGLIQFEKEFAAVVNNCQYAHRFYPELANKAAEAGKAAR